MVAVAAVGILSVIVAVALFVAIIAATFASWLIT
jgi:hypothetical protein